MKFLNPLALTQSIYRDDVRDEVFDDFVTMMEPIVFTLACVSDLITSWNRHRKESAFVVT
jgi:hypothetical protein